VSLIAKSCGIVINPGRDDVILQREQRKKREKEIRERAAEIWKKTQAAQAKSSRKSRKRPSRIAMEDHHLSEEED